MNAPLRARAGDRAWLFGRTTDLWAFGAPALFSVLLVVVLRALDVPEDDTPDAIFLVAVVGVDVAHVWSTLYRTYSDPLELRRRPALYLGAPILVYLAGVALHLAFGPALFWRVLAYAAVFHFVRQQYGWLALYRRRIADTRASGKWIDTAAIYLATLGPLVFWHASPPRQFHWFVEGDFALGLPPVCGAIALGLEACVLALYTARALFQASRREPISWGKHLLVSTTALSWWLGIVALDADYAFTLTNVLIHGVPYFALIWRYGAARYQGERGFVAHLFELGAFAIYLPLVAVALAEEGLWDAFVWHDHAAIFGDFALHPSAIVLSLLVPLLAVPQGLHYLLDGFIWRVGAKNPELASRLRLT